MRRALVLLLLVSGCGDTPAGPTTSSPAAITTTTLAASSTTVPPGLVTTTTDPTSTTLRVPPEGDPSPDFTLALGEGGTFTLSEEHRPVFLLFWAEW